MQKLFQNIKRSLLTFTTSEFIQDKRIKRSQQTMERRIQVFLTEKNQRNRPHRPSPKRKQRRNKSPQRVQGELLTWRTCTTPKESSLSRAYKGKSFYCKLRVRPLTTHIGSWHKYALDQFTSTSGLVQRTAETSKHDDGKI